ncbi:MAG: hypothetical protein WCC17_01835 [Candidatus Nitrosopolaris sp.]
MYTTTTERKTIIEDGTPDEINRLRQKNGPAIKTVYKKIRNDKLRKRFEQQQYATPQPVASRRDNPKLFNKDFRAVTDGSIHLVLALNFPEVSIREDEEGRIHEKLMESASRWLKEGGLLVMHVEKRFLPRVITSPHFMLQFYHGSKSVVVDSYYRSRERKEGKKTPRHHIRYARTPWYQSCENIPAFHQEMNCRHSWRNE